MNKKNLVMFGLIGGIAFFFIGAMINNVFPSSETSLASYKVSACIKLIGIGAITASMVVGGLIIEDIDKNLRMLLLILGLVILIIYSVGSPMLEWSTSASQGSSGYQNKPSALGVPGFELIIAFMAISIFLFMTKKRYIR